MNQQAAVRWAYSPYGETVAIGPIVEQPVQYTGREHDEAASAEPGSAAQVYYYRARYYSPGSKRFISEDPIGIAGGLNVYGYVGGNPISFIDPLGLETNVTIWQPTGWGSSSFGHVSTDINETTYSWGPRGMSVLPTADYLGKNNFRDGMGLSINLMSQQEAALKACLSKPQGNYSAISNNCGSPIQSCLKQIGLDTGSQLLPVSLGNKLLDMGVVKGIKEYPASHPSNGGKAPWAR